MQPLSDHLLIRVEKAPEKTESGLYLGKPAWEIKPPFGTIEAIGPDILDKRLKVGERVLFMRYGATQTNDEELKLVKEGHILAIVNGQ